MAEPKSDASYRVHTCIVSGCSYLCTQDSLTTDAAVDPKKISSTAFTSPGQRSQTQTGRQVERRAFVAFSPATAIYSEKVGGGRDEVDTNFARRLGHPCAGRHRMSGKKVRCRMWLGTTSRVWRRHHHGDY